MPELSTVSDAWEQLPPDQLAVRRVNAPIQPVRDAWDDEEDESEEDPLTLWKNANTKAPMPELLISGSGASTVLPPPPAAFQPALKILKRQTCASFATVPQTSLDKQKTYKEREAQYQAARQRIFQDKVEINTAGSPYTNGATSQTAASRSPAPTDAAKVKVLRGPHGPTADSNTGPLLSSQASGGFRGRQGEGRADKGPARG